MKAHQFSNIPQGRVHDLGILTLPLLICGGAYSNLEAVKAVLEIAEQKDIAPESIIHTGDMVAYCADPVATIEVFMTHPILNIQGNVEESLIKGQNDCGCGFAEGSICEMLSTQWFSYVQTQVLPEHLRYMAALPDQLRFRCEGRQVHVVHGSVTSINQFIFPSGPEQVFAEQFALTNADIILSGHSGLPFTRCVGENKVWHNAGSLGMPANDGTTRGWYSILWPDKNVGIRFEHCALDYDYQSAQKKMRKNRLPKVYMEALSSGVWPNQDILPVAEQKQRSVPLAAHKLYGSMAH